VNRPPDAQPRVSGARLLADLAGLARIGGRPDGGVDRVAGSEADREARRWLVQRLEAEGCEAGLDEHGNVLGHARGSTGPWLLAGSHTDTVPAGGRLDGAYGVVAAVEVLRALREAGHPMAGRLQVVSFHDEEGVASDGLIGSRALAAGPHAGRLLAYLELHIEQGPRLEAEGLQLGVVEAIVGIDRWEVRLVGRANHAGTTPMAARRDAGRAAARVIAGLRELLHDVDPDMVGNVGQVTFLPGAPNVVPGEARFLVQLRSPRTETLDAAGGALRRRVEEVAAAEGCRAEVRFADRHEPAAMDAAVAAALERVCAREGRRWRRLVSGAGHDAGSLAARVPTGMLFVPSHDGVSHSPAEHTGDGLLVLGAQALLEAVVEVAAALEDASASGLRRLDDLSAEDAEAALLACCGSRRWAAAVAAGRPYASPAALCEAAERAWWALAPDDWLEAFAVHPRIGERETADVAARREQAGVAGAPAGTLAALAEGNRRYEERFGHVFLVFASGRSADELLAELRRRLDADPETELRTAAGEQAKITRLRLERLVAGA
jgi:beta-ureidopropionase / N-carbamoyl-L-amino-acid hydrolase